MQAARNVGRALAASGLLLALVVVRDATEATTSAPSTSAPTTNLADADPAPADLFALGDDFVQPDDPGDTTPTTLGAQAIEADGTTTSTTTSTTVVEPAVAAVATTTTTTVPTADPGLIGLDRARWAMIHSIPRPWLETIDPPIRSRTGDTSLAYHDANWNPVRTEVGTTHLSGDWHLLRFITTHEWAHHVAYVYGGRGYPGAPRAGFPGAGQGNVAELWADCAAWALTGVHHVPPGHRPCTDAQRTWTAGWFATQLPG